MRLTFLVPLVGARAQWPAAVGGRLLAAAAGVDVVVQAWHGGLVSSILRMHVCSVSNHQHPRKPRTRFTSCAPCSPSRPLQVWQTT